MNLIVVGCAAPQLRFEVQKRAVEVGTGISDKLSCGWVEDFNFILKHRQELSSTATHQFRHTITNKQVPSITGGINTTHKPFFISNDNSCAWGVGKHVFSFLIVN